MCIKQIVNVYDQKTVERHPARATARMRAATQIFQDYYPQCLILTETGSFSQQSTDLGS